MRVYIVYSDRHIESSRSELLGCRQTKDLKGGHPQCWVLKAYARSNAIGQGCKYLTPYLAELLEVFSFQTNVFDLISTYIRLMLTKFLVGKNQIRDFTTDTVPIH